MYTEDGEAGFDTVGVSVRSMQVKRLYVVNDGSADLDMLLTYCLLHPMDYRFVKGRCGDHEIESVRAAYHEECIDELEFEVIKSVYKRDLYDVAYDLYGVDGTGRIDMSNMIFVTEVDDGYVEFSIADIRKWMWDEFVEEMEGDEEEEEDVDEERI